MNNFFQILAIKLNLSRWTFSTAKAIGSQWALAVLIVFFTSILNNVHAEQVCSSTTLRPDSRYVPLGNGAEVQDRVTGLIWQRCAVGQSWSGSTCSGNAMELTWQAANAFPANLAPSPLGLGVSAQWRLASPADMMTLLDTGCTNPSLNTRIFPNTPNSMYWVTGGFTVYGTTNGLCFWFDPSTSLTTNCWSGNPFYLWLLRGERVTNKNPVAVLQFLPNGRQTITQGDSIYLSAALSTDPDGTLAPAFYQWDFGDQTPIQQGGVQATHLYLKPGTYTVSLTIQDNERAQAVQTAQVIVLPRLIAASVLVDGLAAGQTSTLSLVSSNTRASQSVTVSTNGMVTFTNLLPEGATYSLSITRQPETQLCSLNRSTGTVTATISPSAQLNCVNSYSVGGNIWGLAQGQALTIKSATGGSNQVSLDGNGGQTISFVLPQRLVTSATYHISLGNDTGKPGYNTVRGLTCVNTNAAGVIANQDIRNIQITCTNVLTVGVLGLLPNQEIIVSLSGYPDKFQTINGITSDGIYEFTPAWTVTLPQLIFNPVVRSHPSSPQADCAYNSGFGSTQVLLMVVCKVTALTTTISGLKPGESLALALTATSPNLSQDQVSLTVSASTFSFTDSSAKLPGNSRFNFFIDRQPRDQYCRITNELNGDISARNSNDRESISAIATQMNGVRFSIQCNDLKKVATNSSTMTLDFKRGVHPG